MDCRSTKRSGGHIVEVKSSNRHIRDIVSTAATKATIVTVILSGLLAGATWVALSIGGELSETTELARILLSLAVFLIGCIIGASIWMIVARPLRVIVQAIVHTAGEATTTPPPNPDSPANKRANLEIALKTIYGTSNLPESTPSVATQSGTVSAQTTKTSLESSLDATPCGFVVYNTNHELVYHNATAPVHDNTDGKPVLELIFNGDDTLEKWWQTCEQNAVHEQHIWTRIPDRLPDEEGRRFFDVIASYDKGSEHEIVLCLVDRTYVYASSEQDLDFIAFAAHELRGPITVIRGYLDVLEDELGTKIGPEEHELFRRLTVSANRLSGYINNILNTSKFDRRHLRIHLAEERMSDIYDQISDDMALRAQSQNRLLSVAIPQDLPTVAADKASVGEVFGNLIDNAIKYSNEGGSIRVSAQARGDMVEFSVQDNGIGMPGNVVSNLFQKFYRSHRSRETVAGTGIGLYISKAIVESHGGHIDVSSEEGKGSIFTVSLPIYSTVAAQIAATQSNESLIQHGNGWIKNHNKIRG